MNRTALIAASVSAMLLLAGCADAPPTLPTVPPPGAAEDALFNGTQEGMPGGLASLHARRTVVVDDDGADCRSAGYNSIQAAVDDADAGTTILVCAGTYNERVLISGMGKNGLRLIAQGEPGTAVLDGIGLPPSGAPGTPTGNHGFHLLNVSDVLIQGFTLRRYFENIRLTAASSNTVRMNRTTAAGHDGITLANSAGNLIEHNVSFDNLSGNACGVLVAAGSVGNLIRHNTFENNNWGIRILGGSTDNRVFANESRRNRSRGIQNLDAPPGSPPSGGTAIESNRVEQNPIGIDILSSGVTVARNHAFHNTVFDLMDGGTNNVFINNHCATSNPDGLCAHSEGASK